ncbi:MAG TPA: YceH family protein [Bryobacteraceae bacterium]|nr:YceH family protein [Bryobacteraceae bacterium]
MEQLLDTVDVRVLGCLIEKDLATPEYYPMTLNALVNACNQKSNRDPVVNFDEELVDRGLESLRARGLVSVLTGGGNRVPKYGHRIGERLNLGRRELALLCELMVRGPQTPGELRGNAARMHRFSDPEEVEACLRALSEHPTGPLAVQMSRQPGRKEARYGHLLAGQPDEGTPVTAQRVTEPGGALEARLSTLEQEVQRLSEELRSLRESLGA